MKLYNLDPSPYCARVRMQIYAKGLSEELDVTIENVAWPPDAAYRRLTGTGKVPALDVDGEIIIESAAIGDYLEDLGRGPALRPVAPMDRARMRVLIALNDLRLAPSVQGLIQLFLAKTFDSPAARPAWIEIRHALHLIEGRLSGGGHAVASQLTLADCALLPTLFYVELFGPMFGMPCPLRDRPTIARYCRAAAEEPAVARVLEELRAAFRQ